LLAALALSACAAPPPRPWDASGEADRPARAPAPFEKLPDIPDAFRAELRAGRAPDCPVRGDAVYLGEGRFLTAAHLVDGIVPLLRRCTGTPIQPTIRYAGRVLPVKLLRVGQGYIEPGIGPMYQHGEDLALLQAPIPLPGPAARPCKDGPRRGQAVLVFSAWRKESAQAGVLVPEARAEDGAYADIRMAMKEGESGAGVYDAASFCLLGVVSHRPDATPDRVRIVPAGTIRTFLGG
jgi:hypothetical protein